MIFLGFLAYAEVASLLFSLSNSQRAVLLAINTTATGIILLLERRMRDSRDMGQSESWAWWRATFGAIRDWLPCFLIILAYREAALFSAPRPLDPLNGIFEGWDIDLLGNAWVASIRSEASPWLDNYLEFTYLLCYPVVPLGFAVVFLQSRRLDAEARERDADRFWTGVLSALVSCYALFPLFPLTTPRLLFHDVAIADSHFVLRRLNVWLLSQFAGSGGVFPSGHVAGATAVALSVWQSSRRWGAVFVVIALSITPATVLERYHYIADAAAATSILTYVHNRRP